MRSLAKFNGLVRRRTFLSSCTKGFTRSLALFCGRMTENCLSLTIYKKTRSFSELRGDSITFFVI